MTKQIAPNHAVHAGLVCSWLNLAVGQEASKSAVLVRADVKVELCCEINCYVGGDVNAA